MSSLIEITKPKNLDECIDYCLMVGPLSTIEARTKLNIREFLAFKFQTSMSTANDEESKVLSELWCAITGDKSQVIG